MRPGRRHLLLAAALSLTLAAVVWASRQDDPEATATAVAVRAPARAVEESGPLALARVEQARAAETLKVAHANAFAARSFYVAPPAPKVKPVVAAPPPPPTAPPLPFSYMGMLKEGGRAVVFVTQGERMHTLRVGDVIDGTYRVEAIGADAVTFVYLPMNERQTLSVGGSS